MSKTAQKRTTRDKSTAVDLEMDHRGICKVIYNNGFKLLCLATLLKGGRDDAVLGVAEQEGMAVLLEEAYDDLMAVNEKMEGMLLRHEVRANATSAG